MKPLLILGIVALVVVIGVGMAALGGYNYVIGLDESAKNAWAEVDNQLKRRNDLVPELVATVKGAGIQEQTVYLGIAKAREAYFQAKDIPQKAAAGQQMDGALSRLLLLQEQYPQLKSNEEFLKLHDSLEGTENRLAVARERYNKSAQELNAYVRQLPGRFWAMLAGVDQRTYYEIAAADRERPNVDFQDLRGEGKSGEKKAGDEKPADEVPAESSAK